MIKSSSLDLSSFNRVNRHFQNGARKLASTQGDQAETEMAKTEMGAELEVSSKQTGNKVASLSCVILESTPAEFTAGEIEKQIIKCTTTEIMA